MYCHYWPRIAQDENQGQTITKTLELTALCALASWWAAAFCYCNCLKSQCWPSLWLHLVGPWLLSHLIFQALLHECSGVSATRCGCNGVGAVAWKRQCACCSWTWLSEYGTNVAVCTQHMVAKMFFTNVEPLGDVWMSGLWAFLFKNSSNRSMLESNLHDVIPCNACNKAENISNYNKSRRYFRWCWQ